MSVLVDKLTVAEHETADVIAKLTSAAEKADELQQKITAFAGAASGITAAAAAIKEEIGVVLQKSGAVAKLLADAKTEGTECVSNQANHQQQYEKMLSVFGEAFSVVSKFLETAQEIGLAKTLPADVVKGSERTLAPVSETASVPAAAEPEAASVPEEIFPPAVVEGSGTEPIPEEPVADCIDTELPPVSSTTVDDSVPNEIHGEESADTGFDTLAAQLDVPPLGLDALPAAEIPPQPDEIDDQEIEDMLTDMMKPVTA